MTTKLKKEDRQALNWIDANAPRYVFEVIEKSLAEQAEQEPEVWYCPDCGTLSETQVKCCPDWIRSRKVTKNFAITCKATFDRNGQAEQIEESLGDLSMYVQTNNEVFLDDAISKLQKVASTICAARAQGQAEQEPVAYLRMGSDQRFVVTKAAEELVADTFHQLYAAPVRTKDLTDAEILKAWNESDDMTLPEFARAVIAADREKNK